MFVLHTYPHDQYLHNLFRALSSLAKAFDYESYPVRQSKSMYRFYAVVNELLET